MTFFEDYNFAYIFENRFGGLERSSKVHDFGFEKLSFPYTSIILIETATQRKTVLYKGYNCSLPKVSHRYTL